MKRIWEGVCTAAAIALVLGFLAVYSWMQSEALNECRAAHSVIYCAVN